MPKARKRLQHDIFTSLEPAHEDCRLQKIKSAILFGGLFYFHTFSEISNLTLDFEKKYAYV
ncbi:MAG: hypothetical protein COW37_02315 [Caldiserica bacterium CG17_big_fil_post_rev_8_21_14_2_50_35_7]|nr:MAG: hypothetical protein COW37_02315 [Caldiserica bacterium CG17_big_fil_post_rev_8_21_14_2_50_35_7]